MRVPRARTTNDQLARFLGRDLVSSFEVVDFEPDRRIRIRTVGGGLLRVFDPLTRRMVARSVRGDYDRLAALLGPA